MTQKHEWRVEEFDFYSAQNHGIEGLERDGYEITSTAIGFRGTGQWGAMVPHIIVLAKKLREEKE